MDEWQISRTKQQGLLGITNAIEFTGLKGGEISQIEECTLVRISYILKIYKHLYFLLPEQNLPWIIKPNKAFDGASAIEVILTSSNEDGYLKVVQYLSEQYDPI